MITGSDIRGTTIVVPASIAWPIAQQIAQQGGTRQGFVGISSSAVPLPERQRAGRREQVEVAGRHVVELLHGLQELVAVEPERADPEEVGLRVPKVPIFGMIPPSALTGAGSDIVLPREAPDQVDYEGELVVVMARRASGIAAAEAWDHVAGVTAGNDVSARDVQLRDLRDIATAKSYPTFKPMGPALVPLADLADPDDVGLETTVNGELRQKARTGDLIFSVPALLEFLSRDQFKKMQRQLAEDNEDFLDEET